MNVCFADRWAHFRMDCGHGSCTGTDFGTMYECYCDPYWYGASCDSCDDNTCDSRPSYFSDRYVYCIESIVETPSYCTSWMGCYGTIPVPSYGNITGDSMSICE